MTLFLQLMNEFKYKKEAKFKVKFAIGLTR